MRDLELGLWKGTGSLSTAISMSNTLQKGYKSDSTREMYYDIQVALRAHLDQW